MTEIHRGLDGVVVGETRLSHVDGEAGVLLIGGYPLEELAPNARFEETLFLLWNDRLPRPSELEQLHDELASRRALPPVTRECLREAAAAGLDAMDALRIGLASLGVAHPELHRIELQREDAAATQRRALRLVAAMATLATAYQRLREGEEPVAPDPSLGHAANTLYMFSGRVPERGAVRALETYLNTAVDHGMSASTFAARVIASTRSDLASAVVGALGALKGPLHGGAPGPALDMVFACRAEAARTGRPLSEVTDAWVRRTLAEGGRVMGFGHRVYKVRDPRADVLAAAVERLFPQPGANPLYDDARAVEAVVLEVLAELKPGRRLQTNVEFYTALLLHGLGLPSAAFTPTFAVARVGGWTAHVLEQVAADRLIRPLVAYVGARDRRWREAESRTAERPERV